jgi:KipI family sensor histidine kinase inhibitor
MADEIEVVEFGEAALLVRFGDRIEVELNGRVHALAGLLEDRLGDDRRWERPVPAYASLLIGFDPAAMSAEDARIELEDLVAGADDTPGTSAVVPRLREIPVRYGGADGPDLADVSERLGVSEAAVIDLHASATYTVFMLGFVPGFPYLGVLPAELDLPRLDAPRTRVPAGSVGIAGRQTGIYPFETPGGWRLIGRTHTRLWDPAADPPALLAPGDEVRFVPT